MRARAIAVVAMVVAMGLASSSAQVSGGGAGVGRQIEVALSGVPMQVSAGQGAVWVLTCNHVSQGPCRAGSLLKVSTRGGRLLAPLPVSDPGAFAVSNRAVWVAHFLNGKVTRIDARTGHTTATILLKLPTPVVAGDRRFLPSSISATDSTVWVSTARGRVARIAVDSPRLLAMLRSPSDVTGDVVAHGRAAWLAESSLGIGVARANRSDVKVHLIRSGATDAVAVDQVTLGGDLVWAVGEVAAGAVPNGSGVLTTSERLAAVTQETASLVAEVRLPTGSYSIAYADGALFAANSTTGRLYRIDTHYRVRPIHCASRLGKFIAITPGAIWTTTASNALLRIPMSAT